MNKITIKDIEKACKQYLLDTLIDEDIEDSIIPILEALTDEVLKYEDIPSIKKSIHEWANS